MPRPNKPTYFAARRCWRFNLDGKRHYFGKEIAPQERPIIAGVPERAWRAMNAIIEVVRGKASAATDPTVFGLAQLYLQAVEADVAAGRVVAKQYQNHCSNLATFLAHPGVRDLVARGLAADVVDDFFEHFEATPLPRTSRPPSGHHVHNVGRSIRSMFRWAARPVKGRELGRLLAPNPLEGYRFPGQPGAVRGYVDSVVVRRFLRFCWARARSSPVGSLRRRFDRLFVLMLRFERLTGCRPGEATGLEWGEVQPPPPPRDGDGPPPRWEPRVIEVRPERTKTRKQTSRARKIHVTPPVARLLRAIERLEGRHPAFVFTHARARGSEARGALDKLAGEPWPDGSSASHRVARLRREAIAAGIPGIEGVGPRKLVAYANRHAYASEGSSLGFSDEQISEQMGNTPAVMRRVYAHSVDGAAAERAGQIAERRRRVVGRDEKRKPAG